MKRFCRVPWADCLLWTTVHAFFASSAMADLFGTGATQFTIDFVTISANTNPSSGISAGQYFTFTGVAYDYRMGVYEITNDQWNKFKVALGVPVTGSPASAYDQAPDYTALNVPTNRVSWYEAAQFVNWLNTSTGHQAAYRFTGEQGTSSYALALWDLEVAAGGTNRYRHKDAFYFLPTEAEWVKAAYWNGTSLQTYSNALPTDLVAGVPDPTKWNYGTPPPAGQPWAVGSGAMELNGTFDMMGNVSEILENYYNATVYNPAQMRAFRGGAFTLGELLLRATRHGPIDADGEDFDIGFRVASMPLVPEPSGLVMLLGPMVGILLWRRRKRSACRAC